MPIRTDVEIEPGLYRVQLEPTLEELDYEARLADAIGQNIADMTPAEAEAWIETNVTDLASAKTVLKVIARVVAVLLYIMKRQFREA